MQFKVFLYSVCILYYGGIKDLVTFNTAAGGNTNNPSNDISEILNLGMVYSKKIKIKTRHV